MKRLAGPMMHSAVYYLTFDACGQTVNQPPSKISPPPFPQGKHP
jgi:hypothetical protein